MAKATSPSLHRAAATTAARLGAGSGQSLVEVLIALSMLAIAVGALLAVLTAGAVSLQRSDQKGTALTIADRQLERYRAGAYADIRLLHSPFPAAGTTYATANAADGTIPAATPCLAGYSPANCLVVDNTNGETACAAGTAICTPAQTLNVARTATRTNGSPTITGLSPTSDLTVGMDVTGTGIPSSTTIASISGTTVTLSAAATSGGSSVLTLGATPDHRTYEVDTYITYYSPPSGVAHGAKQVLVVVRDPTRAGAPILARDASNFQPLTVATN